MTELIDHCSWCTKIFTFEYDYSELIMDIGVEANTKDIKCEDCGKTISLRFESIPELTVAYEF